MRGREKLRRRCLSCKEQSSIDRRGQHGPIPGMTRQRMRIRTPREGVMGWAWLYMPQASDWRRGANLMLSCSDREGDLANSGTLYYLYAADLVALREKLIAAGFVPGPITYPDYLPKGEFKIKDPDGHTLMLAQNNTDTP